MLKNGQKKVDFNISYGGFIYEQLTTLNNIYHADIRA